MFGTCNNLDRCVDGGSDFSAKVLEDLFDPYYEQAKHLVSMSTPEGGRRRLLTEVGGCPLCVLDDRDNFIQHLINDLCCFDHGTAIGKWIKAHKKNPKSLTSLCAKHSKKATEAWILVRSENNIELGSDTINVGHVAFAFKRHPS